MTISIEQLRSAFDNSNQNQKQSRPNNYFPFWNMKDGDSAIIRFLPDKNSNNPMGFLIEKLTHRLLINGEKKTIPCRRMHDQDCPICKVSSSYYKEEGKESPNGKKYWRTKNYLAQVLVVSDPLPPNEETGETFEGQVKYISLGYQLYGVIKEALTNGSLDDVPFSYENGYNFIIKKTKQGKYSAYTVGSRFETRPAALSQEDVDVIEPQLIDLSTLLPQDLGEDKVAAMLEAALTGAEYEDQTGASDQDDSSDFHNPMTTTSAVMTEPEQPVAKAKPPLPQQDEQVTDGEDEADKILAQIEARRRAKKPATA